MAASNRFGIVNKNIQELKYSEYNRILSSPTLPKEDQYVLKVMITIKNH